MGFTKEEEELLVAKVNDYVVYKRYGICQVEDIRYEKIMDETKLYYVLQPLYENKSKVFLAVDAPAVKTQFHPVLTKEEIDATIDATEALDSKWIEDAKPRQIQFEAMLSSGDRVQVLWLVKVLSIYKEEREKEGKKFYASDERILSKALKIITEEFAFVLNIKPDQVVPYILKHIDE